MFKEDDDYGEFYSIFRTIAERHGPLQADKVKVVHFSGEVMSSVFNILVIFYGPSWTIKK